MKTAGKSRTGYILAGVTVLVILFFVRSLNVNSLDRTSQKEQRYYDKMENTYIDTVKDLLEECHLYQSGVNLTRVTSEEGNRTYTLNIYNGKAGILSEETIEQLTYSLQGLSFEDESTGTVTSIHLYGEEESVIL